MTERYDVHLAIAAQLDEPDHDRAPLDAALEAAGIRFRWVVWTDPAVDWSAAPVCYPRTTWDYPRRHTEFLAWARRVETVSNLRNPAHILAWNTHKRYLLDLAERGLPVVPTELVERGATRTLDEVCEERGWHRIVFKPAVSVASWETRVATLGDQHANAHWGRLVAERDMLVQPFIRAVDERGERCCITIDGELTHVIRKEPRFAGGHESVTGPYEASAAELEVVRAALDAVGEPLDYGRVDLVEDEHGQPMIAELELVEPSLFFRFGPHALERFVALVARRAAQ